MSYCVHCGVKLDPSLKKCPLCNTPVIDPNEIKNFTPLPPFPEKRAETEQVKSKDVLILLSIALLTISITSGALNFMFFPTTPWSLLIIGFCIILWIAFAPKLLLSKIPIYISLLLDGIAVALYLYFISCVTVSKNWLYGLGFPILILVTLLMILFAFLMRNVSSSMLASALYAYLLIPVLCIGIELLICIYREQTLKISWSAIVAAPCIVVSIILITILSKKRLREAVRRRLHF